MKMHNQQMGEADLVAQGKAVYDLDCKWFIPVYLHIFLTWWMHPSLTIVYIMMHSYELTLPVPRPSFHLFGWSLHKQMLSLTRKSNWIKKKILAPYEPSDSPTHLPEFQYDL